MIALALAATVLASAPQGRGPAVDDLAARFRNPPAKSRMLKIIHNWPDAADGQDAMIRHLHGQGFGGVVCNVSFDQYLESDVRWQAFIRAVGQARKAGMSLWLYDEKGYPSGTAGKLTLRGKPEWEAAGLLVADKTVTGGEVSLDVPPGELVLAAAYPLDARTSAIRMDRRMDLRSSISGAKLRWDAPLGRHYVVVMTSSRLYDGTHVSISLGDRSPYINLLMPEPTKRYIELTHDAYARRLGSSLGQSFVATFTDEPSLMSMFFKAMPYKPLPWSPGFAAEFRKRRGYDVVPVLAMLAAPGGAKGMRVRHDYWLTVGELVSDGFFGQIRRWCGKHGILSGGHLLAEESVAAHVPLYGDFFRCIRQLEAPSIDCLTSVPTEVPWWIARLVCSAGELTGNTSATMSETSDHTQVYRPSGDTRPVRPVSPAEIRGTCNRLFLGGINTITSYYTFRGLSDADLRSLNEYVGRCCTSLAGGRHVTDVAMVYPAETMWTRTVPSRQWTSEAPGTAQVESTFHSVTGVLYEARRDLAYIDSRAICDSRVAAGSLRHGQLAWRVVVLPCVDTLPIAAWRRLGQFAASGGIVVAVGALPLNSTTEFPSGEVLAISKRLFGTGDGPRAYSNRRGGGGIYLSAGSEALLPRALDAVLEADVTVTPKEAPVRVTHRKVGGRDVLFAINDGPAECRVRIGVRPRGGGQLLLPETGAVASLKAGASEVSMAPYGSVLIRASSVAAPARRPLRSGPIAGASIRPLKTAPPAIAKGEFVDGSITADATRATGSAVAWRATATITKSQTDTFMMAMMRCDPPVNVKGSLGMAFNTWVPPGQSTPIQLLIILRDRNGTDYYAETGRLLSSAGKQTIWLPLSRFHHAPFTGTPDRPFDFGAISTITLGWGGYLGEQGERVEFAFGPPMAARL